MKKIIFLLAMVLLLSASLSQSVFAIGQMTKPIIVSDVMRGQDVVQTLKLYNSGNQKITYSLKADGDVATWATFYKIEDTGLKNPITKIEVPARSQISAIVNFQVPKDTPNGQYLGEVAIISGDINGESAEGEVSVNVMERIGRSVSITVTDKEKIDLEATVIPAKYGIRSGDSLKIKINYYNKGNIALRPDVQLKILKDGNALFNATFYYPESEDAIRPGGRKTISAIEWQTTGQSNGNYVAEVKILNKDNVVLQKSFKFSIGNFNNGIWVSALSLFKENNTILGWFIVGAILVVIALLWSLFKKRGIDLGKGFEVFSSYIRKLF